MPRFRSRGRIRGRWHGASTGRAVPMTVCRLQAPIAGTTTGRRRRSARDAAPCPKTDARGARDARASHAVQNGRMLTATGLRGPMPCPHHAIGRLEVLVAQRGNQRPLRSDALWRLGSPAGLQRPRPARTAPSDEVRQPSRSTSLTRLTMPMVKRIGHRDAQTSPVCVHLQLSAVSRAAMARCRPPPPRCYTPPRRSWRWRWGGRTR